MTHSPTEGLSASGKALLREVVERYRPEFVPRIDTLGAVPLTSEEREALRNAIARELLATGLDEADEPTARGLELEELVDALGRC